jgi:hypothetical protein
MRLSWQKVVHDLTAVFRLLEQSLQLFIVKSNLNNFCQ